MARTMFQMFKDNRLLRVLVGGSAVVGTGAGAAAAFTGPDSSDAPPADVALGATAPSATVPSVPDTTATTLDVEGTPVTVPDSLPPDTLAPGPADAADSTPGSIEITLDTTGTAPSAGTPDTPEVDDVDNSGPGSTSSGPGPGPNVDDDGHDSSGPGSGSGGGDDVDDNSGPGGGGDDHGGDDDG